MHWDGAWGASGIGITAILTPPNGSKLRYDVQLQFLTTNNIAEYKAVLLGLRKLRALGVRRCIIKSDSQVVVGHIEKTFMAKEPEFVKYLMAVRRMEKHFASFSLRHVPRGSNPKFNSTTRCIHPSINKQSHQGRRRSPGSITCDFQRRLEIPNIRIFIQKF